MKNLFMGVVLALTAVVSVAKPVAYKDFNDGRLYLTDEQGKCPDQMLAWKFEPVTQGELPQDKLSGCFVIVGGDVVVFAADGATPLVMLPQTAFEHISKSKI